MRHSFLTSAAIFIFCVCTIFPAHALLPSLSNGPAWIELDPSQRHALQPLQKEWVQLSSESKLKWISIADKFPDMPPEEQARIQKRMIDWARLSPRERDLARIKFQAAKRMSTEERQARWEAYQALSDTEKRELAELAETKRNTPTRRPSHLKPPLVAVDASASAPQKSQATPLPVRPTAIIPAARTVLPPVENPGVSTQLIGVARRLPPRQDEGAPHIAALPDVVDPVTLLPLKGPQRIVKPAHVAPPPVQP